MSAPADPAGLRTFAELSALEARRALRARLDRGRVERSGDALAPADDPDGSAAP